MHNVSCITHLGLKIQKLGNVPCISIRSLQVKYVLVVSLEVKLITLLYEKTIAQNFHKSLTKLNVHTPRVELYAFIHFLHGPKIYWPLLELVNAKSKNPSITIKYTELTLDNCIQLLAISRCVVFLIWPISTKWSC